MITVLLKDPILELKVKSIYYETFCLRLRRTCARYTIKMNFYLFMSKFNASNIIK